MIFFVNVLIYLFILIFFFIIIICVGTSKNRVSFLYLMRSNVVFRYEKTHWGKNKKFSSIFNKIGKKYFRFRFNFLSIYFKYEWMIKIVLYYSFYFIIYYFFIQLFGTDQIHIKNQLFYNHLQDLYPSEYLLNSFLYHLIYDERINEFQNTFYRAEIKLLHDQYDLYSYYTCFGNDNSLYSNDETNTKLLIQTVIQNEDLKEALYFLPSASASQEKLLSGDMYRLNKDFIIEKNYEFKVITRKKIISANDLFRWKLLYRHVDEIDLGVYNQKNMNLDLEQVKEEVNEINNKHIHDFFNNTISEDYKNYYFRLFLKKMNIDIDILTIEQQHFWKSEFEKELYTIKNLNGTYEEKTKKICEISDIKYKNVDFYENKKHTQIHIVEMDTTHQNIKKCNFINGSGIVFNNNTFSNKSCFKAVHDFINKIK